MQLAHSATENLGGGALYNKYRVHIAELLGGFITDVEEQIDGTL